MKWLLGGLFALAVMAGLFYGLFYISNAKPLSDDDIVICKEVIEAKQGYLTCGFCVEHKNCPLYPCVKYDTQKKKDWDNKQ